MSGQTYDDLILHEKVPELVYLQTRKLLREVHFKYAECHREQNAKNSNYFGNSKIEDANKKLADPQAEKKDTIDSSLINEETDEMLVETFE